MKYTITFISKKGKVKRKIGCNTEKTVNYIIENWKNNPETKGMCLLINNENKEEEIYKK